VPDPVPILAYARPLEQDQQPPTSPVEVHRLPGGGVRLVDPPPTVRAVFLNIVVVALGAPYTLGVIVAACLNPSGAAASDLRFVIAIALVTLGAAIDAWTRLTRPTVIEAGPGHLRVFVPRFIGHTRQWTGARLPTVQSIGSGVDVLGGFKRICSLRISPSLGLAVDVLRNRDAAEVRWAIAEIRRATQSQEPG
jgi:hypothetical protein